MTSLPMDSSMLVDFPHSAIIIVALFDRPPPRAIASPPGEWFLAMVCGVDRAADLVVLQRL